MQKSRQPSTDWSRGIQIATDSVGDPSFAINSAENSLHLAWITKSSDTYSLNYRPVDALTNVGDAVVLQTLTGNIRAPQIRPNPNSNNFHIFWIERATGTKSWHLLAAEIDQAGSFVSQPLALTTDAHNVGGYVTAQNAQGDITLIFEDRLSDALFGISIEPAATNLALTKIAETAILPAATFTADNTLHVTWISDNSMRYTAFENATLALTEGSEIGEIDSGNGVQLQSPALAITDGHLYAFWSVYQRSGLEAGTGYTEFISAEISNPTASSTQRLWITTTEDPTETSYSGSYALESFNQKPPTASATSDYILSPRASQAQGDGVAVAIDVRQQLRLDSEIQLAVALFEDGEFIGHQFAAKSNGLSLNSQLINVAGDLHMLWREGAASKDLFYATTAAPIRDELNRLKADDALNVSLTAIPEMLVGIMFFPLALAWILPGILVLGLYQLFNDSAELKQPVTILLILVSLAGYWVVKKAFLPAIGVHVPFSAWIDLPDAIADLLVIGYPIFTLLLGVLVAEYRRSKSDSLLAPIIYYFVIVLVDAVLTLAIYGLQFFGAA